jgi:hypothetical protein
VKWLKLSLIIGLCVLMIGVNLGSRCYRVLLDSSRMPLSADNIKLVALGPSAPTGGGSRIHLVYSDPSAVISDIFRLHP